MSSYDATGSLFPYRKLVKELVRGGRESSDEIRDYDIPASLSRAFLDRHPSAMHVRAWVTGDLLKDLRGVERDVAKSFVNTCFGVGQKGIREWCNEHGFSELHPLLVAPIRGFT